MATAERKPHRLISEEIARYKVGRRTSSAALLAWFLEMVWRLDEADVEHAICDGGGDKGIDALVVDDGLAQITVLQSKWCDRSDGRHGDARLKALVGAAAYFESEETVAGLLSSAPNPELLQLLERQDVRRKITSNKYSVQVVAVTNCTLDRSGVDYVRVASGVTPPLEVWDQPRLAEVAIRTRRAELRPETVTLAAAARPTVMNLHPGQRLALAVIPAARLVDLPGLNDFTLFSRNVRLFAGRTRINKELALTVQTVGEHLLFPAYHNGLTLLTEEFIVRGNSIKLTKVGVVNGCQSLMTLNDNRASLTDDLKVLVKIVEVPVDSPIADLVTYRSNNQNAVTLRDQRSSDPVMRDLQHAVEEAYGSQFAFQIRLGEVTTAARVLDNAHAAQLIMAVYLMEPWAAVRKVQLFDQDFRRIFNRTISAHKLFLLALLDDAILNARHRLRDDLKASFASVRFTLVHLIAQFLRESDAGRGLLDTPERWLTARQAPVRDALAPIADEVVDSVNFHVEQEIEDDASFDPKVVFKSKGGVDRLEREVLKEARRQAKRNADHWFTVSPMAPPATSRRS